LEGGILKYKIYLGCTHNIKQEIKGIFPGEKDKMVITDWPEFNWQQMRVLELNFMEREDILPRNHKYWLEIIEKAKRANPNILLTAHYSFVYNKNKENPNYKELTHNELFSKKPFNMEFDWLVVPKGYKDSLVSRINEANLEVIKRQIDFCHDYDIKNLTVHVTKPGAYLSEKEFEKFIEKINILDSYSRQKDGELNICIETGGVKPSQIEELIKNTKESVKINYDTAHAILDNEIMKDEQFDFNFIEKLIQENRLGEVHLTEVVEGADVHAPLYLDKAKDFSGKLKKTLAGEMNKYMIKRLNYEASNGNVIPAILETKPDQKNFDYVKNILKDTNVFLVCGLQGTGKTSLSDTLSEITGSTVIHSDVVRTELFPNPLHTEKEKQTVYSKINLYVIDEILNNRDVIVDATFKNKKDRNSLHNRAKLLGANVKIIETVCPEEIVLKRLEKRNKDEAGKREYFKYKEEFEPIEEEHYIIDTSKSLKKQIQKIVNDQKPSLQQ